MWQTPRIKVSIKSNVVTAMASFTWKSRNFAMSPTKSHMSDGTKMLSRCGLLSTEPM